MSDGSLKRAALVVFDLDGTLVDSKKDLAAAVNSVLTSYGTPALPEWQVGRMVGDGAAALVARAFEAAKIEARADALERFLRFYDACLLDHTRPYDGIESMLDALKGRVALALLTNKPRAATQRILDELGLARFFTPDLTVCGDGPYPRKPDPAGLLALAAAAGVSPGQVVMVGDSLVDRRTASAAGVMSCVATYGFGFEAFPMDELGDLAILIDSPASLAGLL